MFCQAPSLISLLRSKNVNVSSTQYSQSFSHGEDLQLAMSQVDSRRQVQSRCLPLSHRPLSTTLMTHIAALIINQCYLTLCTCREITGQNIIETKVQPVKKKVKHSLFKTSTIVSTRLGWKGSSHICELHPIIKQTLIPDQLGLLISSFQEERLFPDQFPEGNRKVKGHHKKSAFCLKAPLYFHPISHSDNNRYL